MENLGIWTNGISLVLLPILTIIAIIKGWKWKPVFPLIITILLQLGFGFLVGLFFVGILGESTWIFLIIFFTLITFIFCGLILIFMIVKPPTKENINFLKHLFINEKAEKMAKTFVLWIVISAVICAVLIIIKGLVGIEASGNIFQFFMILSGIFSAVILKYFRNKLRKQKEPAAE